MREKIKALIYRIRAGRLAKEEKVRLSWGVLIFLLVSAVVLNLSLIAANQSTKGLRSRAAEVAGTNYSYDVVVVGTGSGGIAAAIQAARMGMKVALLEETDYLGGQLITVSTMDEGDTLAEKTGIYGEFINRVKRHYDALGKSMSTCYWSDYSSCYEPLVGKQVLEAMIKETANLDLYLRNRVVSLVKDGNTIKGLITQDGKKFDAKIVVDATEYGDLLPLSGENYRLGNSTSEALNPEACVQDITYPAVIKKYPNGVPADLWLANPPSNDSDYSDYKKNVENIFVKYVAKNGSSNWGEQKLPFNWAGHNAYRGLPDSSSPGSYTASQADKITKTAINIWAVDFPYKVSSFDLQNRKAVNCEAKLLTLQFIYYIQHDLGETLWSVANDEGFDTPYNSEENLCDNIPAEFKSVEKHLPPLPYIRESRRVVGLKTLTGKEIYREGTPQKARSAFDSSLAVGYYAADLHRCDSDETFEKDLGEIAADIPPHFATGPFQIPFESFIPATVDGFLVAEKNLSVSRIVNGAIRLQPITMRTGQAVGVLAALSVKNNVQPRNLNKIEVQKELLLRKVPLSLYNFSDVPLENSNWYHAQVASLKGIMTGYGNGIYGLEDLMLRSQVAAVLARLNKLPLDPAPAVATFVDVPASDWAFKYVEAIYKAKYTTGCSFSPMMFCPNNGVTRAELATFFFRALKLSEPTEFKAYFEDVKEGDWAAKYIQAIYEKGYMTPCSETPRLFCPERKATRGEVSALVAKALGF